MQGSSAAAWTVTRAATLFSAARVADALREADAGRAFDAGCLAPDVLLNGVEGHNPQPGVSGLNQTKGLRAYS